MADMVTDGALAALVRDAAADITAEDQALAELRVRRWKQSELNRFMQHLGDRFGLEGGIFTKFSEVAALAEAEGRVEDDLSPTLRNLLAKHGARAWVFGEAESILLYGLAHELVSRPQDGTAWQFQAANGTGLPSLGCTDWGNPTIGAARLRSAMLTQGREAHEPETHYLGLLFASVAPSWTIGHVGDPHILTTSEATENLALAQAERWGTILRVLLYVLEVYRTRPEGELTLPIDEVLGIGMSPGMRWESYSDVDAFQADLTAYRGRTSAAWNVISTAWRELDGAHLRQLRNAYLAAANLATPGARR